MRREVFFCVRLQSSETGRARSSVSPERSGLRKRALEAYAPQTQNEGKPDPCEAKRYEGTEKKEGYMKKNEKSVGRKTVGLTLSKEITVGLSKAKFVVQDDCLKIGELQVSQGSVVWFPKFGKLGYKVNWERFDDIMQEKGRKCRKRR